MSTRQTFSAQQGRTVAILRHAIDAAEILPPLKAVAEVALKVAELAEGFKANRSEWKELGEYVQDLTANVVQSLDKVDSFQQDDRVKLEKLKSVLDSTMEQIGSEQARRRNKWFGRFASFTKHLDIIADMRARLESAVDLFQLGAMATTLVQTTQTLNTVTANTQALSNIAQEASAVKTNIASLDQKTVQIGTNAILNQLKRVRGASWDPSRVCIANTRADLIDEIIAWVSDMDSPNEDVAQVGPNRMRGVKIMVLTAVAGAGKTTVAHTVAQRCSQDGQLVSSFFFDRETKGRNTPTALFTTIAADLSRITKELAQSISTAIEDDRGLLFAPIAKQFEELVLRPCQESVFTKPMVIVLDALDEAWDDSLFDILQDRAHHLPDTVRLFLTCRMRPELDSLCQEPYVHRVDLDITTDLNKQDISEYAKHRLLRLAKERTLGNDWPGEDLRAQFLATAGGLFLWVATVCDYLRRRDNPTSELRRLVERSDVLSSSAEVRMDKLYASILESFDWTDDSFVAGYNQVMGIAIASQTPITISAMKELYHHEEFATNFTMQRLSSLLTGMSSSEHTTQPVRVLHQSLRDFLVIRSAHPSQYVRFYMAEKEKSAELAVLCLNILNRDLGEDMSVVGYLALNSEEQPGVPSMPVDAISEALWYACQFWPDHVCDSDGSDAVRRGVVGLMESKMVRWLEVTASYGLCRSLDKLQGWMENCLDECDMQRIRESNEKFAKACLSLSDRLHYNNRWEESLIMAKQAVELYRRLAVSQPAVYTPDLAKSLNNLSLRLSDMGQKEEALLATQEAVEIRRRLAVEQPVAYTPDLAKSLNNLSVHLSDMGRTEEALLAMQETVEMYRRLVADRPAAYTPDLAMSLNNLSSDLSDMGRKEEALLATQESVEMYRRLVIDRPAAYTPDLAVSLNNLSANLSDMGRNEEALLATQEAVEMYRRLVIDRPAVYTPDLANSLNNLSLHLSDMGRKEEALLAILEAVEMYRRLVIDRPAAYTPDLANSLNNLSIYLSNLGQKEEALLATQEAVEIRRRLVIDRPAAYTPDLAVSLNNLSANLSDMGQKEEALLATQEAVEMYRRLVADRPAAYTPDLAMSLYNLTIYLQSFGRHEEALPVIQEAVQLRKLLSTQRPVVFIPKLQSALQLLSEVFDALGRVDEAQSASSEAEDLSL